MGDNLGELRCREFLGHLFVHSLFESLRLVFKVYKMAAKCSYLDVL